MTTRRTQDPASSAGAPSRRRTLVAAKKPTAAAAAPVPVSADARRAMIAEAAYLRAESRGFATGSEEEDWLAAEKDVDQLLSARHSGPQ
ncbi:MAG: DUF2934 domain-containing protein [Steroidobacteraceae bacterium]